MLICIIALSALTACGPKVGGVDVTRFGLDDAVIAEDLGVFPQDLTVYADRAGRDTHLMDASRQKMENARFDRLFFAAWSAGVPHAPKDMAFEAVKNMNPDKGFAENLRPWDKARWQGVVSNAFMEAYGGTPARPAITTDTAHLRRLPTDAPFFLDPGKGGEGFPFDYMQNSVLWIGTPVSVSHISRDHMWVFVQTSFVSGWTRVSNLAAVDAAFIEAWRSRPMAVITGDNVELAIRDGRTDAVTGTGPAAKAHVGTILPLAAAEVAGSPHVFVNVPLRGADGRAVMATALASARATRQKPLPLTTGNIARVGNAMMGQPYGWGGMSAQRDCSATMRDMFAAFGIWMPRNSRAQGRMGAGLDLEDLSPDAKEEKIMREGVPFFSLVSLPGHVGLYLGSYPKKDARGGQRYVPVMFHNIWGLRVVRGVGGTKSVERAVIGKAVVTSLRPGAEHPAISTPASLLDRVSGLAILPGALPGERGSR